MFSKYNQYLEFFKKSIVCPPHLSLTLLVVPFMGPSTNDLVFLKDLLKEGSYDKVDPIVVIMSMCNAHLGHVCIGHMIGVTLKPKVVGV